MLRELAVHFAVSLAVSGAASLVLWLAFFRNIDILLFLIPPIPVAVLMTIFGCYTKLGHNPRVSD